MVEVSPVVAEDADGISGCLDETDLSRVSSSFIACDTFSTPLWPGYGDNAGSAIWLLAYRLAVTSACPAQGCEWQTDGLTN
jgi:hypothetical protein